MPLLGEKLSKKEKETIVVGPDGKKPSASSSYIFTEGQRLDDVSADKAYPQILSVRIKRDITLKIAIKLHDELRYYPDMNDFTLEIYGTLTGTKPYTFTERLGENDLGSSQTYPNKLSIIINRDQAQQFLALVLRDIRDNPLGTIFIYQSINGQMEEV